MRMQSSAHEDDDVFVMEAALRSFPPLSPFCLRKRFPTFEHDESADPTRLLRPNGRRRPKVEAVAMPAEPVWDVKTFVARFLSADPKTDDQIYVETKGEGLSKATAKGLLSSAAASGAAFRWRFLSNQKQKFATIPQPVDAAS